MIQILVKSNRCSIRTRQHTHVRGLDGLKRQAMKRLTKDGGDRKGKKGAHKTGIEVFIDERWGEFAANFD